MGFQRQSNVLWKRGCESPGPHVSLARLRKRRNEYSQWSFSGKATFLGSGVAKARAHMSALRGLENAGSEF